MISMQYKLVSAAIGVSAAIAMSAIGVAFSTTGSAQAPFTASPVTAPHATTGQTVTKTKSPSTPEISRAKPQMTGPAPLPPEEQGLPG